MHSTPSAARLTLLTVNIHKGVAAWRGRSILAGLRRAVQTVGADVVCLQEVRGVWHEGHEGRRRHGAPAVPAQPQYEALADGLWPQHAYGRNAVGPRGDHGNAVLSRLPIVRHQNHDVSHPGDEARGLLHCVLSPSGGRPTLNVVCVHLGLREAIRRRQLAQLATLVDSLPERVPLVVAGDFNDWRRRADALLARCGLHEVFQRQHGSHARSFPARWPLLALDRIYVRGMRAAQPVPLPRSPWRDLSDHAPLAAELTLDAEAA